MRKMDLPAQFDLLTELQPLESLVEVYGNQRILIENHRGVCEYTGERIVIKVKNGNVSASGTKMRIVLMTKDRLVIQGLIESISFCKGVR